MQYVCINITIILLTQSVEAVKYTDCISAKGPWYDIKQPDGKASVMLELWGMLSTLFLPSLPSPLWPAVVAPDRILSMC